MSPNKSMELDRDIRKKIAVPCATTSRPSHRSTSTCAQHQRLVPDPDWGRTLIVTARGCDAMIKDYGRLQTYLRQNACVPVVHWIEL